MYQTQKYNNGQNHVLDEFETKEAAIESARTLHHPDWPAWQGIIVVGPEGMIFDSNES